MAALTARTLKITVAGTEYNTQVFTAEVESGPADADDVTYAEAAAGGGRVYFLNLKLTQDMATGTLWRQIFDNAGDDVAVVLMPYGNASPSSSQPHYTCTANVREPDGVLIGGEADASTTKRQVVEVQWPLTAKPVEDTTP
jgi:hypothetical protein